MNKKRKRSSIAAWTDVGSTWSKYGRAMGKVALEGVADALRRTATALDETDCKKERKLDCCSESDPSGSQTANRDSQE